MGFQGCLWGRTTSQLTGGVRISGSVVHGRAPSSRKKQKPETLQRKRQSLEMGLPRRGSPVSKTTRMCLGLCEVSGQRAGWQTREWSGWLGGGTLQEHSSPRSHGHGRPLVSLRAREDRPRPPTWPSRVVWGRLWSRGAGLGWGGPWQGVSIPGETGIWDAGGGWGAGWHCVLPVRPASRVPRRCSPAGWVLVSTGSRLTQGHKGTRSPTTEERWL